MEAVVEEDSMRTLLGKVARA
eukprot:SAG31_NODE_5885_length_2275_cov_2.100184_3_plen_20_part_01